jgi:Ca-activated chloride channel family protein
VIHTVCPLWKGGNQGEADLLKQCYLSCLDLAQQHGIREIAFPALGTGAKGFPPDRAAQIALETISQFLLSSTAIGRILLICADSTVHQHFTTEFQRVAGW